MTAVIHALLAAVALAACVDDRPGAEPDRSAPLFDPDRVIEIDLQLAPADWDSLRQQTRSWADVYGACLAAPFGSPFTWFAATAAIDGAPAVPIGLRKKGFLGSLDADKPSLKLALDDERQRQLGVGGLTLNNARQDPSFVRQCLGYRIFAAAGLAAPRCNFARVRVNGDDLGLYVHVEAVDRALLARHFADDGGNLYEGTFSDFRAGWTATFDRESGSNDRRDLDAVVAALDAPDGALLETLGDVVALDPLFRFWAVEVLIAHRDGFTGNANNFFAYADPASGRFHFLPWGADQTFVAGPDPLGTGLVSVQTGSRAPWRLYQVPAARDRYVATLRRLLDDAWDEDALARELDRMEALIAPIVDPDGTGGLHARVDVVRGFVRDRRAAILAELDAGPPASSSALHAPPCFDAIGALDGTLATTWGTTLDGAFASGDGTLAGELAGAPLVVTDVGAAAGWDPDAPAKARLYVVAALPGGDLALVALQLDAARLRTGARLPLDGVAVSSLVYRYVPASATYALIGPLVGGTLDLEAATPTAGAPLRASFHGAVVAPL